VIDRPVLPVTILAHVHVKTDRNYGAGPAAKSQGCTVEFPVRDGEGRGMRSGRSDGGG
jgi:hypothetical protein